MPADNFPDEAEGRCKCCCRCYDLSLGCWNTACSWDVTVDGQDYRLFQYVFDGNPATWPSGWANHVWKTTFDPITLFGCTVDSAYFGNIGDGTIGDTDSTSLIFCDSTVISTGHDAVGAIRHKFATAAIYSSWDYWCMHELTLRPVDLHNACSTPVDDVTISVHNIKYCSCGSYCLTSTPKYVVATIAGMASAGSCPDCTDLNSSFVCTPYQLSAGGACEYRYTFDGDTCWPDQSRLQIFYGYGGASKIAARLSKSNDTFSANWSLSYTLNHCCDTYVLTANADRASNSAHRAPRLESARRSRPLRCCPRDGQRGVRLSRRLSHALDCLRWMRTVEPRRVRLHTSDVRMPD